MKTETDWAAYHAARNIDLTPMLNHFAPSFSASVAEIGEGAGRITWGNAINNGPQLLVSKDQRAAFREYLGTFGAWDRDEIDAFSDAELNALLVQRVAGDIREAGADSLADLDNDDLDEIYRSSGVPGLLFQSDSGAWFYCISE